jgi:glycosyltransferase involved in cell wall biosynthesis
MHVLFSAPAYRPAWRYGGPVVAVSRLAESLAAKGVRVTVFTSDSNLDQDLDVPLGRPVDVAGVEVWYFPRRDSFQKKLTVVPYLSRSVGFLYTPSMAPELDRLVPSVDIVHTQAPFVYGSFAAARVAARFGKPLVYHQHGAYNPQSLRFRRVKKSLYIAAIEKPIMRRAAVLVALTEFEASSYRRFKLSTPIRVIPNGIDLEPFAAASGAAAGDRWGIPPDAPVVLFLGRLHPTKGADRLLEAFLRIERQFPRSRLVMAGPDEWGMEEGIRLAAASVGKGERVILPGMVNDAEKADLLARADLLCLPSRGEGFSIAILEALASGKPVLISPECHFDEVEAKGGGRVAASDPATLSVALAEMLSDTDKLRVMGQKGRRLVEERYTWSRVADLTIQAYREALDRVQKGQS